MFDEYLFHAINQFAGRSNLLDDTLRWSQTDYFKTVPIMMIIWGLWFSYPDREQQVRERLAAIVLLCLPVILTARVAAALLPFKYRPLHTPGLEINLAYEQNVKVLDGWSSMPSDHAAFFFALSVGLIMLNRKAGIVAGFLSLFVICLPRIYFGWHWPSDIVAGAALGILMMVLFIRPVDGFIQRTRMIPYFMARPWIGYPLFFLATFEMSQMFFLSRSILSNIIDL